jgi:L-asparaginase/Glu-tRNA(Gln) amidotransferase subunit D
MIPCDLYTLESLAKDKISSYKTTSNNKFLAVEITNWGTEIINKHISSQEHKDELNKVLIQNLSKETIESTYEFYTDGSLIDRSTETMKMGAAWLQTMGPNPGSLFFTGVSEWPSSFRAETTAILIAILTVTPNSKVTIYTDSQNCIDTYNKLTRPDPKRTVKK